MTSSCPPTQAPWLQRQAYNMERQRWLESCTLGERAAQDPALTPAQREHVYLQLCQAAVAMVPWDYSLEVLSRYLPQISDANALNNFLEQVVNLTDPAFIRRLFLQLPLQPVQFHKLCSDAFARRDFDKAEALGDCWVAAYPGTEANSASTFLPWVYWRQLRYEKALQAFQVSYAHNHSHEILGGQGLVLNCMGRYAESVQAYEGVALHHPLNGQECRVYSGSLFGAGRVQDSMLALEGRLQDPSFVTKAPSQLPRWQGEPLKGKLLVLTDVAWSWGDHLQYLRYFNLLHRRHPDLRLQIEPPLATVARQLWPDIEVVEGVQTDGCAAYVWLMSLPVALHRLDTAADEIPWLRAPTPKLHEWEAWLARQEPGHTVHESRRPKIGLCWKGNPNTYHDKYRSLAFSDLTPIFNATPHVDWVNLQYDQSQAPPPELLAGVGSRWLDPIPEVRDFIDTVAIASCLDEVLTVDTSTAHACGSAGVPMTLIVPVWGEWRWQHDGMGEKSIWYPNATLVRTPGGQTLGHTLQKLADGQWLQRRLAQRRGA